MPRVLRAYKFRLYPTSKQEVLLNKTFGCVRKVWNERVAEFNGVHPNFVGPVRPAPKTIKLFRERFEYMKEVSAVALQQKDRDWEEFKSQFFDKSRKTKLGLPKFKDKNSRQSYRLEADRCIMEKNLFESITDLETGEVYRKQTKPTKWLQVQRVGKIPIVQDRLFGKNIERRNVTISKDSLGHFYASTLVYEDVDLLPKTGKSIGIDLGIRTLLTLSNGKTYPNLNLFRESQSKLAKAQRIFARKKKGSSRYKKARLRVARIHKKIARQREHYYHTITLNLVKDFDFIGIEDLNVAGMKKNRCLAKSVSDASFFKLVSMLQYKAAWYGKTVTKVGRWFPSSKNCSKCGNRKANLTLAMDVYVCDKCGHTQDRDLNAAINIEVEATRLATAEALRGGNAQRTLSDQKTTNEAESAEAGADCVEASKEIW